MAFHLPSHLSLSTNSMSGASSVPILSCSYKLCLDHGSPLPRAPLLSACRVMPARAVWACQVTGQLRRVGVSSLGADGSGSPGGGSARTLDRDRGQVGRRPSRRARPGSDLGEFTGTSGCCRYRCDVPPERPPPGYKRAPIGRVL